MTTDPVLWWKTALGPAESAAVGRAIAAGHLSDGPITAEFEARFAAMIGARFAVAVPSGSAALLASTLALGVRPGDEVIVPACTWIATAHAASLLGATVVLAEVRHDRPVMDIESVRAKITPRTKAILPVHLGGRAVDMEPLLALARRHGIAVVEDACQALLSRQNGKALGTFGDIGCYSLGVAKLLTTGQGGVAATSDPALYERLRAVKFHGVVPAADGWERYATLGFNFKFADVLAAIGIEQLAQIKARVAHVCAIYRAYESGLANLPHLRVSPINLDQGEVPLWTEIESPHAVMLMKTLKTAGIQTRRTHPALHQAPHLGGSGPFPNASRFAAETLILPSGPTQPIENVERTIDTLRRYLS